MNQKRVLVVDDNPTNLKLIAALLATEPCDVITAASAEEALALVRAELPDLMLLDLQLPDLDGLTLTRMLRADPHTAGLPIVAVTAFAMKGDEEKARTAGVDDYVTKPIAKEAFRKTVASFLGGKP